MWGSTVTHPFLRNNASSTFYSSDETCISPENIINEVFDQYLVSFSTFHMYMQQVVSTIDRMANALPHGTTVGGD